MAAEFQITGEYDATIKTILSSARHTELSIPTEQRLNLVGHLLKHMHQHHDSEPEVWHDVSDTKSAQAAADAVYSPAYQKRKIKKDASLDIHGRPVRYYRYVSVDDLFHILRDGEDNPLRHHKNPFSLVESGKPNDPNFRDFLEKVIESKNMPEVDRDEPITSLLYKAFPQVNKATLDKMFGVRGPAADWKRIFLFFEKHVDVAVLKKAHAVGSWLKEYSPFMSVNPGVRRDEHQRLGNHI